MNRLEGWIGSAIYRNQPYSDIERMTYYELKDFHDWNVRIMKAESAK